MRTRSIVFSVVLSLVSVVFLLPARGASAAGFAPTNLTVAVDRNTVTQGWGETVTSTFSFCVPDAQGTGDSFTITLPAVLANWPAGFSIADGTGAPVIDVTIASASPAVATFTLTPYGAGVTNLCAIAKFGADSGSSAAGTYPLRYVIGTTTITRSTPTASMTSSTWSTGRRSSIRKSIPKVFEISCEACRSSASLSRSGRSR